MPAYFSGLDLGQLQDYSALVVVEREGKDLGVRRAHRWPLSTPYPAIVESVRGMFDKPPLADSTLVVDRTGVGVAVVDFVRDAGIRADVQAWNITAGLEPNAEKYTVPKADLVAAVQVALGTHTLKIAEGLKHGPLLKKELENFRVRVTEARNETYSARDGEHDDLVLALALAVWQAAMWSDPRAMDEGNRDNYGRQPWDDLPPGTFGEDSRTGW